MEEQLYKLFHQCTLRIAIPGKEGYGTGFFVAPGLILTCAHVIGDKPSGDIEAHWNGQAYPAQITSCDVDHDLALLSVSIKEHPCVLLREEVSPFDSLYCYGYTDQYSAGEPATFSLEGKVGDEGAQLKFKSGQVRPGLSGSPILNTRTGGVCGVVQLSRGRESDLGGRAIPTTVVLRTFPELTSLQQRFHQQDQRWMSHLSSARNEKIRKVLIDQSEYVRDRLSRFVGREQELTEIRARLDKKMNHREHGGYVILKGDAGQGKSSIIARLIGDQGIESSIYHFIQPGSGNDRQLNLLRNLMAQLILKYDLSEDYVSGVSYDILCSNFIGVIRVIASRCDREMIFIDGLDQLEKGSAAAPDLNFLPVQLPKGIVLVLGTRPNRTLDEILHLIHMEEQEPYELKGLRREDFDLLLHHRAVPPLPAPLIQSLYQRLTNNPLYLDLVARELRESGGQGTEALIKRVANNPDDIFTITFSRMQSLPNWGNVIRPILGVLRVAQEPLTVGQIGHIIQQGSAAIIAGTTQLGGLLTRASQEGYTLFHPKLREYLKRGKGDPRNEISFGVEEEETLHGQVADWCGQGPLEQIWLDVPDSAPGDDYQQYAQKHYIFHLHAARRDGRLFAVLNDGSYERAKLHTDPSTRSTATDLMLGSRAAARGARSLNDGKWRLPHLWRYTLLRTSLTTRADAYPLAAFRALLALGRDQDALNLAELLTQPASKLAVLNLIAEHLLKQPARETEGERLANQVYEIATSMQDNKTRSTALRELAAILTHANRLTQAEEIALLITDEDAQAVVLNEISAAYTREGDRQRASKIAHSITSDEGRVKSLSCLAVILNAAHKTPGEASEAETLWQEADAIATTITGDKSRSRAFFSLAVSFMQAREWQRAKDTARSITLQEEKVRALSRLALSLTRAGRDTRAAWEEAQDAIAPLDEKQKGKAYGIYAQAQVEAGLHTEANETANKQLARYPTEKIRVLGSLATDLIKGGSWEQSKGIIDQIVQQYGLTDVGPQLLDTILARLSIEFAQKGQWEQARETALAIPRKGERCTALMRIVSEQAQAGLTGAAQKGWEEASAMCKAQADTVQASVAATLVVALVAAGQSEQIDPIISSLPNKQAQEGVREEMAVAFARVGQVAEAAKIAHKITSPTRKASIQRSIARAQMEAGQSDSAIEAARVIHDHEKQSWVLLDLIAICCDRKQWKTAQKILSQIPSEPVREEARRHLIEMLVNAQELRDAEKLVRDLEAGFYKEEARCVLATALARIGREKDATRIAREIRGNPRIRQKAQCNISLMDLFGPGGAETDALAIEVSDERDETLFNVAREYACAKSWPEAERIAGAIVNKRWRDEAWSALAFTLAQAEQWEQAIAALDRIEKSNQRRTVLQKWGNMLAQPEHRQDRERIEQHLSDSKERATLLVGAATELARHGQYLEQIRLIQHAWLQASTKDDSQYLFTMVQELLISCPEMCLEFYGSFEWADTFLAEA